MIGIGLTAFIVFQLLIGLLNSCDGFHFSQIKFSRTRSVLMADPEKMSFWEILRGNAQVKVSKQGNPEFYSMPAIIANKLTGSKASNGRKIKSINEYNAKTQEAVKNFKAFAPTPRKGGSLDISAISAAENFLFLASLIGSEDDALDIIKSSPVILSIDPEIIKRNLVIYREKWGVEVAEGVVKRNPNLLVIRSSGYNSAEMSGEETIAVSYLIAALRPIGQLLENSIKIISGKYVSIDSITL